MAISSPEPIAIVSVDQQESCQLVKLIRKLRWIGMEREAELVARAVGPSDTD